MFEEHPSENCWRASSDVWAPSCWARCCSPKPAITLAASDHHRPFIPSLVPNHPRTLRISPIKAELQDMSDLPQKKRRISLCVGCGSQIHDQYILRVAPDLEWHAACLKCAECQQFLDETCTCFVRDGKTYCKRDYVRLFGTKCDKCSLSFNKTDFVMRAKTKIYHIECFRCNACQKHLVPGDEFALREDGLFCKEDHEELSSKSSNSENNNNNSITNNNNNNNINNNNSNSSNNNSSSGGNNNNSSSSCNNNNNGGGGGSNNKNSSSTTNNNNNSSNINSNNNSNSNSNSLHHHHHNHNEGSNSDSSESGSNKYSSSREIGRSGGSGGGGGGGSKVASDGKPTRVRTVLNEKQLHMLRTCYAANPRPDALMKEQLVERTALSPRVIRVWFQNKRCKDKKRAIAMKQQMQHEKEGRKMGYGSMQGIPMVASSPVRHESPIGISPIEVQSYPAPWKALSDFALHQDLDRLDMSTPHFQQIVNQMHGYDLPRPLGIPPHDVGHVTGPNAPGADMIHPDSTDSLVTYMESDESLQHDPGSP